ncbi:methylase [Limosilactobacillus fermentum]
MSKEEISLFDDQQFKTKSKKFKLKAVAEDDNLIKSKDRVQHHGEVFTPKWMVQKMLAEPAIQEKLHDLHATFFEPSAGEGAFLKEILHQKLEYVDQISNKTNWKDNALMVLMSIYAIELLKDNLIRARQAMMDIFVNHYQAFMQKKLSSNTDVYKSAKFIIKVNIVQGNTLTYKNSEDKLIKFNEWISYGNKVKRSTFTYRSLLNNSDIDDADAIEGQLSLFDKIEDNDKENIRLVKPTKVYEEQNE